MRQHAEVHEMPVIGAAIVGRILAHRRNHDAVGEFEARHMKRREQGTGHGIDSALAGKQRHSPLLDGFQIDNDGTHILGIKLEFRHVWMA